MHETALALGWRAELSCLGAPGSLDAASGSTATSSPWPAPSTPARTRSSATSSPSACSACRGSSRALRLQRRPAAPAVRQACATSSRASAPRVGPRPVGDADGRSRRALEEARGDRRPGPAGARGARGPGHGRDRLRCCCWKRSAAPAWPSRWWPRRWWRRRSWPSSRRRRSSPQTGCPGSPRERRSHRRRDGPDERPSWPTPTSRRSCCCLHGDEVHAVFAVPPEAAALTLQPANDPAPAPLLRRLDSPARDPRAREIARGGAARAQHRGAFDRGAFACAAQQLGVCDRLIEMAADYARQRVQFGVAIGSFQAVKHQLADLRVKLEYARSAVYRAAHSVARDAATRSCDVSMAKVLASEAALAAARTSLQVHGAIGYTWEQDLHVFMRRGLEPGPRLGRRRLPPPPRRVCRHRRGAARGELRLPGGLMYRGSREGDPP